MTPIAMILFKRVRVTLDSCECLRISSGTSSRKELLLELTKTIARIVNPVQCQSFLSGHFDCQDLRFSLVRNVKTG